MVGRAAGKAEARRGSRESSMVSLILSLSRTGKGKNTGGRSPAGLSTEPLGVVDTRVRKGRRLLGRVVSLHIAEDQ
jgi:hypothetical protein